MTHALTPCCMHMPCFCFVKAREILGAGGIMDPSKPGYGLHTG